MTRNSLHSNKPSSAASHRGAAHGPKQTATAHPPSHEPFGQRALREMLSRVAAGEMAVDAALQSLAMLPFEDLGFANLDHHRGMRKNFPEVVFCAGKTTGQVATIIKRLAAVNPRVLGTRATREQYLAARRGVPGLKYHELARAIWLDREAKAPKAAGVAIVAAGTSDLHVAEEAAITLELMGQAPQRVYDVGVAGLHRLIQHLPALRSASVVVAVAGMEGALPSVLGGLLAAPIIAVPTSVGYGTSFGGVTALLGMLNSCAPGISVVNIDNGFGAGYIAGTINRSIGK